MIKLFKGYKMQVRKCGTAMVAGLLLLGMQACHTSKKALEVEEKKPAVVAKETLHPEDFLNKVITWNTFSGKADMHVETQDQNQDFTGNIRMHKGKDIWVSAIALGIAEVARASITPDSLRAIIRIGKKAYALSYKQGQDLIQTQVDFPVLQNLFIGNPLMSGVPVAHFEIKDSTVLITQIKDDFTQVLTYNKKDGTLQSVQLNSAQKQFSCNIRYEKYGPTTLQQPFAYNRYIDINNKGQLMKLNMEFSKAELDIPVETNFTIPDSYTIMNIPKKN